MLTFATQYLSGTPITETDVGQITTSSDMFVVSHPILKTGSSTTYESDHVTYDTLSTQLFSDLSDKLGFGTMAFADEGEYALSGHHHAYYNKAAVQSLIRDPSEYTTNENDNIIISAAKFRIDGKETIIRGVLPNYHPISVATSVGTISYVGWPPEYIQAHVIDPLADSFDGWVYCDGRTITCDSAQFKEAQTYFNGSQTGDGTRKTFTVPLLTSFAYFDGAASTISHTSENQLGLVPHYHNALFKFNAQIQVSATFQLSPKANDYDKPKYFGVEKDDDSGNYTRTTTLHAKYYNGTMHAYGSKTAFPNMSIQGQVGTIGEGVIDCTINSGPAVDEFGQPTDPTQRFWPNYQYMVPMIYIGTKNT